jgi:plastocyanin
MQVVRSAAGLSLLLMLTGGCDDETTTVAPTSVPPSADMAVAPTPTPGAKTVMVAVGPNNSLSFVPQTVTINVGDTVQWNWSSTSVPHTVTSGTVPTADGKFCSLPSGSAVSATTCNSSAYAQTAPATYSHTFTTAGMYPYFCEVHGTAMTGMVVVNAAPTPTTPADMATTPPPPPPAPRDMAMPPPPPPPPY